MGLSERRRRAPDACRSARAGRQGIDIRPGGPLASSTASFRSSDSTGTTVPSLRPRPSLPPLGVPLLLLVVLAASVAGGWLLVGGSAGEASHELGAVTVHNTGPDAHRVEVQVRRGDAAGTGDTTGGDDRTVVADATLRVEAASVPTPTDGSGVATGVSVAGRAAVERTWDGAGSYRVRARLVGADAWAGLDLARVGEADDDTRWGRDRDVADDPACYRDSSRTPDRLWPSLTHNSDLLNKIKQIRSEIRESIFDRAVCAGKHTVGHNSVATFDVPRESVLENRGNAQPEYPLRGFPRL